MVTLKVLPCPLAEITVSLPPCSSTTCLHRESPNPDPCIRKITGAISTGREKESHRPLLKLPGIDLNEVVEQLDLVLRRYAGPLVLHIDHHVAYPLVAAFRAHVRGLRQGHLHHGAAGRELDGIAQQVGHHVLDLEPVAQHRRGEALRHSQLQAQVLSHSRAAEGAEDLRYNVGGMEVAHLQLHLALLDLLHAQHVIQCGRHKIGRTAHDDQGFSEKQEGILLLSAYV